jgi:hypothetical protein
MKWQDAKKIMGKNFIGPDELTSIALELNIAPIKDAPAVPYDAKTLKKVAKEYLLILGVAKMSDGRTLTLNNMREFFGLDSAQSEPCYYNQDWYLKEKFANATTLKPRWYLLRKQVPKETRAVRPDILEGKLKKGEKFPTAILTAFTFFAYYFLNNKAMLWRHDFIWCSDKDKNGDRIYTGRYQDPKKINKNGFNIHRHLAIRSVYGAVIQFD